MNKEYKKLWLEALRSGDYKQARGRLMDVDDDFNKTYCCLGVLCKVAKAIKWRNGAILPLNLLKRTELEDTDPQVFYKRKQRSLSELNDDVELSFKQIANIIEKQL